LGVKVSKVRSWKSDIFETDSPALVIIDTYRVKLINLQNLEYVSLI